MDQPKNPDQILDHSDRISFFRIGSSKIRIGSKIRSEIRSDLKKEIHTNYNKNPLKLNFLNVDS